MSRFDFSLKTAFSNLKRRHLLKFFSLFGLCLALAVSCGSPQSPDATGSAGSNNGRITIGTTLKPQTLDPADAYQLFPGILLYNLGDRLYTYKPGTTELVPQLATAMPQVSGDGLTYTIPLRTGVTFHDGTPFDAKAMAFSIDRFIKNEGGPAALLGEKVESVAASGANELTIQLKAPFAGFPAVLAFSGITPVPPSQYEIGVGKFQPTKFIGTGPYKLAELTPTSIRLDPNENYWGEKPANQGIDIQVITSSANLFNTFRTGGLDLAYQTLDPDQIRSLTDGAKQGNWQVVEAGTTSINFLTLNVRSEPLNNVKVRQAIASMVDRNLLNQRVFQGQAEILYSLVPTGFPVYKPAFQKYGDGDYAKARTLLAEAGITEANPLVLDLWYSSNSTTRNLVATTLKAAIEQNLPGLVRVNTNTVEIATLFDNLEKGTYPITLLDWYPDFYDADTFVHPFLACDEGSAAAGCQEGQTKAGGSFYFSDRANDLVQKQRAEQNAETRKTMLAELQDLVANEVPYIPLWQNKDYIFARKEVTGVAIQPTQQFLLWQLKKS
jgi:peptide/nickel transport system substrate-binding protein